MALYMEELRPEARDSSTWMREFVGTYDAFVFSFAALEPSLFLLAFVVI